MKFKKYDLWTEKEDSVIKRFFHSIPLSNKQSRFEIIKEKLELKGFKRTKKSISRRSYRLGLRSYERKEHEPKTITRKTANSSRIKKTKWRGGVNKWELTVDNVNNSLNGRTKDKDY